MPLLITISAPSLSLQTPSAVAMHGELQGNGWTASGRLLADNLHGSQICEHAEQDALARHGKEIALIIFSPEGPAPYPNLTDRGS